jgi:hypothetical protein
MNGSHRGVGVVVVVVLSVAAMAGCARSPVRARSVPYLRAHPRVLATLARWCTADPGHLEKVPACVNAREASLLNGIGSFQKLPPIAFPPVPGQKSDRAEKPTSGPQHE